MRYVSLVLVLLPHFSSSANESLLDIYNNTIKSDTDAWLLDIENDAFRDTDRYYTNGIRLTHAFTSKTYVRINGEKAAYFTDDGNIQEYGKPVSLDKRNAAPLGCDKKPKSAYHLHYLANVLNCYAGEDKLEIYKHNAGWHFANLIYTPTAITARFNQFRSLDRPYAGYTYYSRFAETLYADDSRTSYELQFGVLGRASFSQEVQKYWHQLWGLEDPTWEKQIGSEPAVQFNYNHRFPIPWFLKWDKDAFLNTRYADAQPFVFIEAGTVFMRATVGFDARVSLYNMKSYFAGPLLATSIIEVIEKSPEPAEASSKKCIGGFLCTPSSAYLFFTAEETVVLRNSTIEGGMFSDSPYTQHAANRVRSTAVGVKVAWERWWVTAAYKTKSPEVEGIPFDEDFHRWGEIQIGLAW